MFNSGYNKKTIVSRTFFLYCMSKNNFSCTTRNRCLFRFSCYKDTSFPTAPNTYLYNCCVKQTILLIMLCDNVLQTDFNVLWVENCAKLIIFAVAVSSFFLDNSDWLIVLQRYARHRGCPIFGQKKISTTSSRWDSYCFRVHFGGQPLAPTVSSSTIQSIFVAKEPNRQKNATLRCWRMTYRKYLYFLFFNIPLCNV